MSDLQRVIARLQAFLALLPPLCLTAYDVRRELRRAELQLQAGVAP